MTSEYDKLVKESCEIKNRIQNVTKENIDLRLNRASREKEMLNKIHKLQENCRKLELKEKPTSLPKCVLNNVEVYKELVDICGLVENKFSLIE